MYKMHAAAAASGLFDKRGEKKWFAYLYEFPSKMILTRRFKRHEIRPTRRLKAFAYKLETHSWLILFEMLKFGPKTSSKHLTAG